MKIGGSVTMDANPEGINQFTGGFGSSKEPKEKDIMGQPLTNSLKEASQKARYASAIAGQAHSGAPAAKAHTAAAAARREAAQKAHEAGNARLRTAHSQQAKWHDKKAAENS